MEFSIKVEIGASPERVWEVMSDVERWPEWTSSVRSLSLLDPGPLAVGSRARVSQPKLPTTIWKVSDLQAGLEFSWINRGPGAVVTARHRVDPSPGGCVATLSVHFAGPIGPVVGWLTRGLNRRYLRIESEGLKRESEKS